MPITLKRVFVTVLLLIPAIASAESRKTAGTNIPPVIIDYFYEAGCADCFKVRDQIEPKLKERFEGLCVMNRWDVGIKTNVLRLIIYQEKLGIKNNQPVCMVVDYQYVCNGFDAIKTGLLERVDECLSAREEPEWKVPEPIPVTQRSGIGLAGERLRRFTLSTVVTAGLIDGMNHCAISTIVFFMSLLAVSKVQGRSFLLMGISFCLASFLTYFAIGLGLLRALQTLSSFPYLRRVLEMAVTAVLVVLAFLSFRDALRYRRTGDPHDVLLQLPQGLKLKIHEIMRKAIGGSSLVVGGFVVGTLVTALEGVCTGQVYVPILAMLAKSGQATGRPVLYLLVYNLVSDIPLVAVLVLTYFGLKTTTLLEWNRKNVVVSKTLTGLLFLVMAVLIVLL